MHCKYKNWAFGHYYSQTEKTVNTANISGMLLSVLQEEGQSGMRKLNRKCQLEDISLLATLKFEFK